MSLQLHPTILREAFMYFAKYPKIEGVLSSIFSSETSEITGYSQLQAEVSALAVKSLIPEITNFLFSSNEDKLKKSIEDTAGAFMLLDYGQINCDKDQVQRKNDQIELGIIIARKMNPDQYDMAETILMHDELLNLVRKLREQMIEDSKYHPFVKQINFPHNISPWYARELCHATGFSMMFSKTGIDIV